MPKLSNSSEWIKLARTIIRMESIGVKIEVDNLVRHTGFKREDILATMKDPTFVEYVDSYRARRFGMWAEAIEKSGIEFAEIIKTLGFKALITLDDLLDSEDEKVRSVAARLALDINPEIDRPIVRHEVVNRFTNDELNQARDIVRKLKVKDEPLPKLPPPGGVN